MKPLLQEARDQLAHFAVGAGTVALARLAGAHVPAIAGLAIGLVPGLVREFTEWQAARKGQRALGLPTAPLFGNHGGGILSPGSLRDLTVWALAGLIGAVA